MYSVLRRLSTPKSLSLLKNANLFNNNSIRFVSKSNIKAISSSDINLSLENLVKNAKTEVRLNKEYFNIKFSLTIQSNKKTEKNYPYIWLRDQCACSECFNHTTEEVELDLASIPADVKPIEMNKIDNETVEIICKYLNVILKIKSKFNYYFM